MADTRPASYTENSTSIYRASAIGGHCSKALIALRLGYEAMPWPASLQEKANESAALEDVVVERLEAEHGLVMEDVQAVHELAITPNIIVRGHSDGLTTCGKVVEIKNLGDTLWEQWKNEGIHGPGFVGYAWQVSVYMLESGRPGVFAVGHKGGGELDVVYLEKPPVSKATIAKKVVAVEMQVRKGVLPECCDKSMWPCPVYYLHEERELEEIGSLEILASTYVRGDTLEKQGKAMKQEVREQLLAGVGSKGKVKAGGFEVSSWTSERRSVDKKAMKEAGIDVGAYENVTESVSLKVREVE